MTRRHLAALLAIAAVAAGCGEPGPPELSGEEVAGISDLEGGMIRLRELDREVAKIYRLQREPVPPVDSRGYRETERVALEAIIRRHWIEAEAVERGVDPGAVGYDEELIGKWSPRTACLPDLAIAAICSPVARTE